MKIRKLSLFLLPTILVAGNIEISVKNNNGQSSYIVNSNNSQNLKSKLIFPFNYNTIDIAYQHPFKYFKVSFCSSFLINRKTTNGEDYDWQNNNLTVYSKSDNTIDKYNNVGLVLTKNVFKDIDIFTKFNYQNLDMHWVNTDQKDYVKNKNEYISENTLKFQQEFYIYSLGIKYQKYIFKKVFFELTPLLNYSHINTKDTHILREFYAKQNINTFGYEINCKLSYNITIKSKLKISFNYIHIKDQNVDMVYYNNLNEKYVSYPSSYTYKDTTIGIHYNYNF